jgi:hypothetical protein
MSYNLLNFPSSGAANRQDTMIRIFQHVNPDLILVCELQSAGGADDLLNVLQTQLAADFQRASYVSNQSSSNDLQNMAFYRSSRLTLLSQDEVITDLRDINEYRFRFSNGTEVVDFDTYMAHLKASDGSVNEDRRKLAIDALKAHLEATGEDRYRIFAGDMNFYDSFESGYTTLTDSGTYRFTDPINRSGNWHTNSAFADIHTQSTRTVSIGGGASGGMDDRFDLVMISESIEADTGAMRYIPGSYWTVGQDGLHYNQAVNDGPNLSVPADVLSALYESSDHLPLAVDFLLFGEVDTTTDPPVVGGDGCGNLFFSEYIEGSSNNKALEIYNPTGADVPLSTYSISTYNNGAISPTNTLSLSGTLAAGETYLVVNASADPTLLSAADVTSSVTFYNGDDAIVLFDDGNEIDAIGRVGEDPGSEWVVGTGSTSEHTLVRKVDVLEGQTDWTIGADQWNVLAQDDFSDFGMHTINPCPTDSCADSVIPSGLMAAVDGSGVTLSWNEIPGSVKCEVQGRPIGAPTFASLKVNVPPFEAFVPASLLAPGTDYEWQVRCACSLSPVVATPFSGLETFNWPVLREQAGAGQFVMYPNPASDRIAFSLDVPENSLNQDWEIRIYDPTGRMLEQRQISVIGSKIQGTVELMNRPAGTYVIHAQSADNYVVGRFNKIP